MPMPYGERFKRCFGSTLHRRLNPRKRLGEMTEAAGWRPRCLLQRRTFLSQPIIPVFAATPLPLGW
jgi:hypothetical protein